MSFQIGRKTYPFQAVVAKVSTPIVGWDFIAHFKLNFEWDHYGDIHLHDRKAGIKSILEFITIPHNSSPRASIITQENKMTHPIDALFFQTNVIKDLNPENPNFDQNLNKIPK